MYKLRHYGKTGDILHWVYILLKQREQGVVMDGKHSNCLHVNTSDHKELFDDLYYFSVVRSIQ